MDKKLNFKAITIIKFISGISKKKKKIKQHNEKNV